MKDAFIADMEAEINPDNSINWAHSFGIKPGAYGDGDILLGIRTKTTRAICKKYHDMPYSEIVELFHSPVHEYRFGALVLLRMKLRKDADRVVDIYLDNLDCVNNWDLVDESAPNILGRYCFEQHDDARLLALSKSLGLWQKRISIVGYQYYYRRGALSNGLNVIDSLLEDGEPLIQKACGWMLRIIYEKVDKHVVESYIIDNYSRMPRQTVRAAIERMPEEQRLQFLHGEF